jgi:hypothetical protein
MKTSGFSCLPARRTGVSFAVDDKYVLKYIITIIAIEGACQVTGRALGTGSGKQKSRAGTGTISIRRRAVLRRTDDNAGGNTMAYDGGR